MRSAPRCALFGVALFGVALTNCALTATPCAWRGSGLAQQYTAGDSEPPGVTQVTLQCSRGTVEWLYPTGALRVKLFPLTAASSQHGGPTICLKPFTGSHGAVLSIETSEHLKRVISLDDTVPGDKDIFCLGKEAVSSNDGAVVMFIQATPQTDISRRIAAFHFELWPGSLGLKPILGKDGKRESEDVCRPCSREEMLTAACTSEFVAQGEMVSIENVSQRGHMAIYISVQRILKQMDPAFGVSTDSRTRTQEWVLWIPLRCGVKLDTGEFMFMGKMRFGEIWLTCAPWLLDFNRAYLFSQTTGSNPCELKLD